MDDRSSMPGWAAFDKDEEPAPRRRVSPTSAVVVAGVVAAAVIAGGVLLPDDAPARTTSAGAGATEGPLPTASGTPAPTLSTSPSPPADEASEGVLDAAPAPDVTAEDGTAPTTGSGEPAPQDATQDAPAAPAPAAPPAPPARVTGPLGDVVTVTVPATSRDSVDAGSQPVTYAAANLLDSRPSTAWRADGDLSGQVLTFTFDRPRQLSSVGLINGYAKVDPVSDADRYDQTRRITQVTWTIDGQEIVQDLRGRDREEQVVTFPPVTGRSVSLRIDAVTAPGDPRQDQTAISEVVLADG